MIATSLLVLMDPARFHSGLPSSLEMRVTVGRRGGRLIGSSTSFLLAACSISLAARISRPSVCGSPDVPVPARSASVASQFWLRISVLIWTISMSLRDDSAANLSRSMSFSPCRVAMAACAASRSARRSSI